MLDLLGKILGLIIDKWPFMGVAIGVAIVAGLSAWRVTDFVYENRIKALDTRIEFEAKRAETAEQEKEVKRRQLDDAERRLVAVMGGGPPIPQPAKEDVPPVKFFLYSPDGDNDIDRQTLTLKFGTRSQLVDGTLSGEIKSGSQTFERTWTVGGFQRNDNLFLTYFTNGDINTPIPVGIGNLYLRRIANEEYTGYGLSLSCRRNTFVECPYALSTRRVSGPDARVKWPRILDGKCGPKDLTPDSAISFSCGGQTTP